MRIILVLIALLASTQIVTAQEREWTLNSSDKEAFLVFGVPDTDDVGLSFWCEIGTNKVSLFVNNSPAQLKENQIVTMAVAVDDKKFSVKAKAAIDKNSGLPSLEGKISITDPLLKTAPNGNTLKVTIAGHINTYPLIDADFTGLLRTCAGDMVN